MYNESYFDIIDTTSKAYYLGLSLADATITKYWYQPKNKFMYRYKLNPHVDDASLLLRLSKEIGQDWKRVETKNNKRQEPYINAVLEIRNKHLVETLIGNFSGDKKPLRSTYKVPDHLLSHFIRGYFDGDGGLSRYTSNDSWELSISGYEPILSKILADIGIDTRLYKDKSILRVRLRRNDLIEYFLNYIYRDVDFEEELPLFLNRKYELAKRFLQK